MIKNKIEDLLEQIIATSRYKVGDEVYTPRHSYTSYFFRVYKPCKGIVKEVSFRSYDKKITYIIQLPNGISFCEEEELYFLEGLCDGYCREENSKYAETYIQNNKVRISELKTENLKLEKYLSY